MSVADPAAVTERCLITFIDRAVRLLSAYRLHGILPGVEGDAKTKHHSCLQGTFSQMGHKHMPT